MSSLAHLEILSFTTAQACLYCLKNSGYHGFFPNSQASFYDFKIKLDTYSWSHLYDFI